MEKKRSIKEIWKEHREAEVEEEPQEDLQKISMTINLPENSR